ncbi:GATA-type domain-containing protein [Pycnococcus provasolii]
MVFCELRRWRRRGVCIKRYYADAGQGGTKAHILDRNAPLRSDRGGTCATTTTTTAARTGHISWTGRHAGARGARKRRRRKVPMRELRHGLYPNLAEVPQARKTSKVLCNACGIYQNTNHRPRPLLKALGLHFPVPDNDNERTPPQSPAPPQILRPTAQTAGELPQAERENLRVKFETEPSWEELPEHEAREELTKKKLELHKRKQASLRDETARKSAKRHKFVVTDDDDTNEYYEAQAARLRYEAAAAQTLIDSLRKEVEVANKHIAALSAKHALELQCVRTECEAELQSMHTKHVLDLQRIRDEHAAEREREGNEGNNETFMGMLLDTDVQPEGSAPRTFSQAAATALMTLSNL